MTSNIYLYPRYDLRHQESGLDTGVEFVQPFALCQMRDGSLENIKPFLKASFLHHYVSRNYFVEPKRL